MMNLYDEEEIVRSYIRSVRYEAAQEAAQKAAQEATQKATLDNARKTAIRLIRWGKMPLEDIAEVTNLPLDTVKELETEAMQLSLQG